MAKEKVRFTDRALKALKPAPKGTDRYEIPDAIVPGLLVRVTETGKKSFVLVARYPGKKNPTRRLLGTYIEKTGDAGTADGQDFSSLEAARKKAREWLTLLAGGVDPQVRSEELKAREIERQANTFGDAIDIYLKTRVIGKDRNRPLMRSAEDVERALMTEFMNDKWETGEKGKPSVKGKGRLRKGLRDRPLSGVTKRDILAVIDDAIARDAHTTAHNCLAYIRAFFNWAIESGRFGLEASPCDRIKPKSVIGKKTKRKRVLTDSEIAALWEAAGIMGYPYGSAVKLLLLTGLRRSEVTNAPRSEFDSASSMWTVPKERMKKDNDHHAPLPPMTRSLIESLPQLDKGEFLFSTTGGEKPMNGFSKNKITLDAEMLLALKRRAEEEGRNPELVKLQPFVLHDIRRTVRTRLSALGVSKVVAELIIAHTQKDLDAVYDQWAFIDERRRALEKWEEKLRSIVDPAPDNVISLPTRTAQ